MAIETPELTTYSVPEINLESLKQRIGKLNKRAKKIGVPPVGFSVEFDCIKHQFARKAGGKVWLTDEELQGVSPNAGVLTGRKMGYYNVGVTGVTPKYDGWAFVATLEPLHADDGTVENLIKTVPGEECPTSVAARIGECDQCNLKRRRTETFVVRHDSGEFKVVGRNCVADFLGGDDPKQLANHAQWLIDIEEACSDSEDWEPEYGSRVPSGEDLHDMLSWAAGAIRTLGWASKASCQFGGTSTCEAVDLAMNPYSREPEWVTQMREQIAPTDDDIVTAESAIEWAKAFTDDEVENNSYLANCRLVAKCAWCSRKNAGIAVSIVATYLRHLDRLKEAERRAARPESHHIGEPKQRLELTVTCERVILSEGDYGTTGIHKLSSEQGDITWFASGSATWLDEGTTYKVKATVKGHDEYKGRKQTIVQRVKILEDLSTSSDDFAEETVSVGVV